MAVDEGSMGELSTLALDESILVGSTDATLEARAEIWGSTLVEWRLAFRQRVISTDRNRHQWEGTANRRFGSRISLHDNCLSVSQAIELACELVPHAEETLTLCNPLGAKPVMIDMFEAEITPNLRGIDFFPITHRFHGEKAGLTEDVFISATWKLSAVCLGGIDAQLSEISSDLEESDDEKGREVSVAGGNKEPQRESLRPRSGSKNGPSVLDASTWDEGVDKHLHRSMASAAEEEGEGGQARIAGSWTQPERPPEICGVSTGPCDGVKFEVEIGGAFEEWDLQVVPPLQDFVALAKRAQLQVLNALARVPCLLEHPKVKPYQAMVDGYGLGFDLPQGGAEDVLEGGQTSASWGWEGEASGPKSTDKIEVTEESIESSLPECDWVYILSGDPYYRGLQDKVFLSLASSHNAVYRMLDGLRPLLEEFQALGEFAAQLEARDTRLKNMSDPDVIAAKLVASGKRRGDKTDSLDLTPVLLATSTTDWLRGWHSRFERYRQKVRACSTACPQVLLSVNATNLIAYLVDLPETSLEEIRLIGPRMMLNATSKLGAVFRRCNAVLGDGLEGVDALGEKAGFLVQIEQWLRQLRDEVKKLQELGLLLKNIGCYRPRPLLPPVVRTRRSADPTNPDESSAPLSSSMGEQPSKSMTAVAVPSPETTVGGGNENRTAISDLAGTRQDDATAANSDKKLAFGIALGTPIDFRPVEKKVQEGLESLEFNLTALQGSVNQAQINMRIASQEFSSLLKKALESLAQEIERLETDILDPALSSAATDPRKACSRLETYRHRLSDLQAEESRYCFYNQLIDNDLATTGGKGTAKLQFDEDKMKLDLERLRTRRKELVLKWTAQRRVLNIREEWDNSKLISSDVEVMAGQLAEATRAHTAAVSIAGADEVTASCKAILGHLERVVEAVGFVQNRDLTGAYWERVEEVLPLREDLKAAARQESMAVIWHAAGLGATIAPSPLESVRQSTAAEGGAITVASNSAPNGTTMIREDDDSSLADSSHGGKRTGTKDNDKPPVGEDGGNTDSDRTDTTASRRTIKVNDQLSVGASNGLSSLATRMLCAKPGDSKSKVNKAAAVASSMAGRGRREEARRRAELFEVFPMAAEWGGLSLSTLLDHGLLEKKREIGSISAEATASAVLRKALEELESVWETAPMMFVWRFNEGPPAPGNIKQELNVDPDSKNRRKSYARVLAEPALVTRGYSASAINEGLGGGGLGGETSHPASEGFTSLLSNGDELLRLAEHCRVVVDSVVDAPPALLATGNIGKAALEWQKRISWFQELITHWTAVQEQWVRLAPAFVPPDLDVGVPAHERVRFTDVSGSFQSILAMLRADESMSVLAGKYQGTEKGGRSLLAKVCKLHEDLEVVSLTMDRWLSSCTAVCPRLLALSRHQMFRLFRDWAAGRVGSGEAAGETNERVGCMFRGVGEIIWKEIVDSTTGGTTIRTHLAATGVRSSGAGLEVVTFSSPVVAVGRFEIWVRNIDRQLMSALAHDVGTATVALRRHAKAAAGLRRSTVSHAKTVEATAGGHRTGSAGVEPRPEGVPFSNQTATPESLAGERSQPSVQARLLARSANWTAAVEVALNSTTLGTLPSQAGGDSNGCGEDTSDALRQPKIMLQEILSSILHHISSWATELCQPGGMTAYNSVATTALTTQALQQRDVLEDLLKAVSSSLPATTVSAGQSETSVTTSATLGAASSSLSLPTAFRKTSDFPKGGDDGSTNFAEAAFSPFLWICHLRHYYTPPEEAFPQNGRAHQGGSNNGRDEDQYQELVPPPPPPLIRVGIGPWDIPYGLEYAGTLERLWLTPLSERCLLHAVHSAKGCYGGLLVSASGGHGRSHGDGSGVTAPSCPSPADIAMVAQDVAVAFGRPFRMLHSGCVTSPQAVSSVIASTLLSGGVTVFAGVEELPKVSLAVLSESLRAVLLCLHARQENIIVNGEEVPLSTRPHLLPNFDPILHQWKLLPWGSKPAGPVSNIGGGGGSGCGPFLGFFATLAKQGPAPQLPLAVRSAFRPVLTALPNTALLLEAMLLTNGFLGARALVQGLVHGLRKLRDLTATDRVDGQGGVVPSGTGGNIGARGVAPAVPAVGVSNNDVSGKNGSTIWASVDAATLAQSVTVKAVRFAAGLVGPETARELKIARRKLGLAFLTSSERNQKTNDLSRAAEARVLIAGFTRALLFEETGRDVRALKPLKSRKSSSSSGNSSGTSPTNAPHGAATATRGDLPKDAGRLEIEARRALLVSTFQQTEILREILKPLEDIAGGGRNMAQQSVKLRTAELAEAGTVTRSRDMAQLSGLVKRALIVNGISPTKDQIDAASELWQSLWSCSRPAVIVTGAAGVGKSAILQAMPKMAEHIDLINRKLNKSLKKLHSPAKKTTQEKADEHDAMGNTKPDSAAQHLNTSPSDPPGAVLEPPSNQRGAAPYRRIINRQVPFLKYVTATASCRQPAKRYIGGGGTVASEMTSSTKGTKATTISDASNASGGSDGAASVFSQRSAASKSSHNSGKSGTSGGKSLFLTGTAGLTGIPRAAIEGSAFVIPAQEIEVVYTGGCSAEHLIGSTDEKGSWLDGLLLRRLRVLVEGIRGSGHAMGAHSRHRACGVGTGDVCPPLAGKAASGFSHGCRSRLLVLDGPVSRLLEGIIAGDHASMPSLTGPLECGNSARCLLLPDGETLALDAWGHVAVETGDVRHLSPSTITGVAIVHLRADGPALIKGMREAWLKKLSRRRFQHPGSAGGTFRPVLLQTVSVFLRQEGFIEGGCCLEDTGHAGSADSADTSTPAGVCASRMRNTLLLLEGLLDVLVEIDENAVVWEPEIDSDQRPAKPSKASTFKPLSRLWGKASLGVRSAAGISRMMKATSGAQEGHEATEGGLEQASAIAPPSLVDSAAAVPPDESIATTTEEAPSLVPSVIAHQNELTPADVRNIEKRLRVTAFLLCVYASIWGMGGHLAGEASRVMCSAYVRQFAPLDLRQHIRESNLFDFFVDIRSAKLLPIGDDAGACPGALPRGMWTLDPQWATQASELSCPLPPSLVIPTHRISTVATVAYKLLGMERSQVLVEGPSGAGKTALLSHLLKTMGKGIPDIAAGQSCCSEGSCTTDGGEGSSPLEAGRRNDKSSTADILGRAHDAMFEEEGERKAEAGVDKRIHLLDRARRWMADAGAKTAAACSEARAKTESDAGNRTDVEWGAQEQQAEAAGVQDNPPNSSEDKTVSQRGLPRSTVYLSMRRLATPNDVEGVIRRALKREKDGVLEAPQQSITVIFLDDVHLAQEPRGDGCGDSPCMANSCAAETIRGMIDGYTALGEVRVSSNAQRIAQEEGRRGAEEGELGAVTMETGLPRLCQVHPDFAPRAPCGPGGDSFRRPSSTAVLAARTTVYSAPRGSAIGAGGIAREMSTSSNPPNSSHGEDQQGSPTGSSSYASTTDRLWRRFFLLALDSPSTSELRSVFSRACSDAFAGDGPISSALRSRVVGFSSDATTKTTGLITSEVWKAVDAMGVVVAEFPHRLHQLLMKETPTSSMPRAESHRRENAADVTEVELRACRLDYFTLRRLLRPLVLGRTGDISTPAAVQQFFCHEIMREIVEPLRESRQRELATFELARLVREKAYDIGVESHEERHIVETWLPTGAETPPMWTNARGLVMAVAYWEQQATKAIMASKVTADKLGSKSSLGGTNRPSASSVSYLEICSKEEDHAEQGSTTHTRSTVKKRAVRTMVAHGVLLNSRDVFSPSAITEHFARAVKMLNLPWPARPDARPLVTPQDVTNVCKCLRQLSLPWSPIIVLRSEDRGMSREGGSESAFRLACALEGAGVVVMDAGAGLLGAKIERINGATPPTEASFLSFKSYLREAVLMCIGKGTRGPYLEKSRDGGEDLWLNPGQYQGLKPSTTHNRPGSTLQIPSRVDRRGDSVASCRFSEVGPLVATKTVLLVKGAANVWKGGTGGWVLRAIMDLVESGDVRRLISDTELLKLVEAEEEAEKRAMNDTHKHGGLGNVNHISREPVEATREGGRLSPAGEASTLGEVGQGRPGSPTASKDEILRWSCWTRGGTDFVYRRIVSYVRQCLTVALCLDDDEVVHLCPSFPALSTCPSVRLEAWSGHSLQLAASRSLSAHLNRPHITTIDTATRHNAEVVAQDEKLATVALVSTAAINTVVHGDEGQSPCFNMPGNGGVYLWSGATHAHLIGALAFGRFQSTVAAFKDPPIHSVSSSIEDDGGQAIELIKKDANRATEDSERLFDAWMALVKPSCCVEVFQAVEACAGGDGGPNGEGGSPGDEDQPWGALKARCFRAMAEEGRAPRAASLGDVLLLFKHICRLGCRRIVERAQTLRRALEAADFWGVHRAHREVEKVQFKKRAKDVLDALDQNNEQMRRVQEEKTKVQERWSEQSKSAREHRQEQYVRKEELEATLLPIKASYEASRDSLSTLQEEDMEFLCTLCLGAGVLTSAVANSSHVAEATEQRKQKGLHPELPFIVETVAVMLGNMSDYPQWVGEWVRLKASPSAKIVRALLLDPAIVDRLNGFDPESETGRKVAKLVIDKMNKRATEDSKKNISEGIVSSYGVPTKEGGGHGGAGGHGRADSFVDTAATQFANQIPLLCLKLESRACGLLAAWVRDTVLLIIALRRAEEIQAEIQADATATRREEDRIRVGNADEVRPLDEELTLRASFKTRLSSRQRTIHHRRDLIKELDIMGGAIEDFAATCRQELHDLAAAAEFFAGDALCFANVSCLAAHLPYTIRTIALYRARSAIQQHGVPVSQPCVEGDESRPGRGVSVSTPNHGDGPHDTQTGPNVSSAAGALKLERYRVGNFAGGVLTNMMQLHSWACPTDTTVDDDGGDDSGGDESDGGSGCGSGGGDGLPFHPAFLDAATLTLSTPKWPLLLDPEGVALRWLRRVYPGQSRLEALLPAAMVSKEVIADSAGKGEVLPVCFTEGGVHSDLALFLASNVHPIGAGGDHETTFGQQDGRRGSHVDDNGGGGGSDGVVVVGVDPQSSTTIILKLGFRLILFESSSCPASSSYSPSSSSSLLFLRDSPEVLARIQLVRFGGVDCVGITASDDDVDSAKDGDPLSTSSSDEGSSISEGSSSSESREPLDSPLPAYVLAGMGLIHQPGFEMSKTMGARLQEELARAFPSGSGMDGSEQELAGESAASIVAAQRGALAYSSQLSATHEAVVALLAARPPCFNADGPPCIPDVAIPPGGEPTTGVSDDVERDQNRVLNNLIETLFAYKGIVEKGLDTVPKCGRALQAKHAIASRQAEKVGHSLTSSALRFLARSGDMLHVWGVDPALYSPIFPGVRTLVQGAIRRAANDIRSQGQEGQQVLERAVVVSLTRSMVPRVADDCKWVLPLAALALISPDDLPATGWWDTCVALVGDRNGKIGVPGGSSSRLKLAKLFKMVTSADAGAGEGRAKDKAEQESNPGDDKERPAVRSGAMPPRLVQVREVVGSWLESHEVEVPKLTELSETGCDGASHDSEENDDAEIARQGTKLSPQQWDLGFDTSHWAGDRASKAVAALARDRGIPMGFTAGVEDTNTRGSDENGSNAFFSTLSQLWSTATTDRATMNEIQAAEAKALSGDDVLRRLVLMETTMNRVFARLPAYVMCTARTWVEWMTEVCRSLSAIEIEGENSMTKGRLRFLLSHPPPSFASITNVRNDVPSKSSSSSPPSSSSEDSDSSDGGGSSKSGSGRGEDSDKEKPTHGTAIASSLATGVGSLPLAPAGEVKPLESLVPHNKVRRDSRERMKIKLGLLDELGMVVGAEESKNHMSAETKQEFHARARNLFGISTPTTRGVTSAKLSSSVATHEATHATERPRSGPANEATKTTMVPPKSSASVNVREEDDADEVEDLEFITFVAESFRPQRDNSDWHREAAPSPIPPGVSPDNATNGTLEVADQGSIESSAKAGAVADQSAAGNETTGRDGTVNTGQQLETPPTSSPDNIPGGTTSDSDSSSEGLPENIATKTAQTARRLALLSRKANRNDGFRVESKAKTTSKRNLRDFCRANFQTDRFVRIVALSAVGSKRLRNRARQYQLEVSAQELGWWSHSWNDSPLIGILMLLALAPDEHLAAKCAAACLMAEGGKDNLHRSIPWREIKKKAALSDRHRGRIQSAMENSHPRAPVVVMAPANRGFSDATSRHFASVLSHIERAAKKAGTSVTMHDASKPAHVLLGRGILVAQARRMRNGHARTTGRGTHLADNANGGPATANMTQSAWEVCLKAATDGGWVVFQEFEGAADCISLIMDGIRRRSAVRSASTAAAQGQEKILRDQQVADRMTAASNTRKASSDSAVGGTPAPQCAPSNGAKLSAQQIGGSEGAGAVPAAARKDNGVIRRVAIPGGARKKKAFLSRISAEHPLFKALAAGEGGTMSTRAQPVISAALRRPLPEPHKNFRIILLSTASSENWARDNQSFCMGESDVVWWRPDPVSALPAAADATTSRGQAHRADQNRDCAAENKITVNLCRDEIVQELSGSAATYDCGEFASAGVEMISENCARYMQRGANGESVIDNGAAINMHLAASLFVLRRTSGASESAPPAASPSRNTIRLPPRQGSKGDVAQKLKATLVGRNQTSLVCAVDGAARASAVATGLSNTAVVHLVAGVLDAEATRLREEGLGDVVKTKLK